MDFDATTVKLKWKAGPSDGGAPITFFCLQYKSRADDGWQEGPKVKPAKSNTGTVDQLTTGTKYEFRVLAGGTQGQASKEQHRHSGPTYHRHKVRVPGVGRRDPRSSQQRATQAQWTNLPQAQSTSPGCWQEGPKVKPAKSNTGTVDQLTTGTKYESR